MNQHGWEKLLCNYFYPVCLEVLSAYFSEYGFVPEKNKIGGVTFRKHDVFVEISYDPETYPRYSLTVVVGIGAGSYDDWGRFTGVPVWSILAKDGVSSKFSIWTFSNKNELRNMLSKIRAMVLDKYIKPLWEDRVKLEQEIKKFVAI